MLTGGFEAALGKYVARVHDVIKQAEGISVTTLPTD
jgi:hypothetical protein